MTQILSQDRAAALADWLIGTFPRSGDAEDTFDLGLEMARITGALLLQRLGYVVTSGTIAKRLDPPIGCLFETRWDDAVHVVLTCMEDGHHIRYPNIDRGVLHAFAESYGAIAEDVPPPPDTSNRFVINATQHCAEARVEPAALALLERLGLIHANQWTDHAIPALWRKWTNMNPSGWPRDTDLFKAHLEICDATLPAEIASNIEACLTFSEDLLDRKRSLLAGWGSEDDALRAAADTNLTQVSFIFGESWRFGDGWLPKTAQAHCFPPSFDGLAQQMAEALVLRRYPDTPLAQSLARTLAADQDIRAPLH